MNCLGFGGFVAFGIIANLICCHVMSSEDIRILTTSGVNSSTPAALPSFSSDACFCTSSSLHGRRLLDECGNLCRLRVTHQECVDHVRPPRAVSLAINVCRHWKILA
eukprot:941972-Amphidinium_carterae.1